MRGKTGAIAAVGLASLVAAPAADPHPGHGALSVVVAQFKYTPAAVNLVVGDSVLWSWNGPDTNHSVTADAGQSMDFDSDAGKPAAEIAHPLNDGYGVTFTQPGTYRYHCKVHGFMTGTITVAPAPTPVQPAPPQLSSVSAKPARFCTRCAKPGTTVRFRLDVPASMRAVLRRRGRTVKEIDFDSPPGAQTHKLKFRKLRAGKYVLRLVAVDNVSGKSSKPADLAVAVTG
jgi:plastocyanin